MDTGKDHFGAIIGDNCKMGINSGVLPGRRIGPNSIVGSHVCLTEDLPPDTIVNCAQQNHFEKHSILLNKLKKSELENRLGK